MNTTILKNSVVFLTGADGGIGSAFIKELINREVKKIYITGLNLDKLEALAKTNPDILFPVKLDVTNTTNVTACVKNCSDTTILINNAGVELKADFLDQGASEKAKFEMAVNYLGVIDLCHQFRPILKSNSNPAIINILSIGSLVLIKKINTYCASKVALHLYTQAIREELRNEIQVIGVYPGYVDTSMVSDVDIKKIAPDELVKNICNDLLKNHLDIFPDEMSKLYANSNKLNIEYLN